MRRPGWAQTTLGEFVPLAYGKALSEKDRRAGAVPVFGSSGVIGRHATSLTNGPTLIVGRKGNVGAAYLSPVACWPIDTVYYHAAKPGTDLRFQFYLLRFKQLHRLDKSTAVPGLSRDDYDCVSVELPPEREQQRIADALDSYCSRLDAATTTLERAQTRLKAYRASVLKAAVEGRLVPTEAELSRAEKRDYEPADVLLKRILAERRRRWEKAEFARLKAGGKPGNDDRWKMKYEEPAEVDTAQLPSLPRGWCWASLDQLSVLLRNGQSMPPRELSGVRTLRISAVRPLSIDFNDVRYLPGKPDDFRQDLMETNDLLFTRYNGTPALVGVSARVGVLSEPTVHPDKLIKVRLAQLLSSEYVAIASNCGVSRRHVEKQRRTTAGQSGISGGDLKVMPIPLPPLAEQMRIAERTEALLSVADASVRDLRAQQVRTTRLRQAILKWAFEGRLVAQDTSDEPAEQLLARIRAKGSHVVPVKNKIRRRRAAAS